MAACSGVIEFYAFRHIHCLQAYFVAGVAVDDLPFCCGAEDGGQDIPCLPYAAFAVPSGLAIPAYTILGERGKKAVDSVGPQLGQFQMPQGGKYFVVQLL